MFTPNGMRIHKKTWPKLFQDILDSKKTFDVRLADFNCKKGDTLVLKEWDPNKKEYTGREVEKRVEYILKTKEQKFWKASDINKFGFQIISFK